MIEFTLKVMSNARDVPTAYAELNAALRFSGLTAVMRSNAIQLDGHTVAEPVVNTIVESYAKARHPYAFKDPVQYLSNDIEVMSRINKLAAHKRRWGSWSK